MASIFSKDKRIIFTRRIKQFWEEYRSKKIGMAGLGLLIMYFLIAIFAPLLTPYDPINQPRLAQSYAMPEWVRVFPQYKDLTTTKTIAHSWGVDQGSNYVEGWGTIATVQYKATTLNLEQVILSSSFSYTEIAPNEFYTQFRYEVTGVHNLEYSLTLTMVTPEQKQYLFWKTATLTQDQSESVTLDSKDPLFIVRLGFEAATQNAGNVIFAQKGSYKLVLKMQFNPLTQSAIANVVIKNAKTVRLGQVHGILGADYFAKDIWSQLVYGAQLSLIIGILAASAGTVIGIFVGVASGYLGGIIDEISMRAVDILLCLPLLPLLLALVNLYGRNVYYIILFIAVFGWQGEARVIRSQTLSIRETSYVETARASGASGFYIMLRHIVPNIIPVAFAGMVLAVPSAVLFESTLSFLGFGDPRVPTWGKMLSYAFNFGGFTNLAWYWIIPPGLMIIGLCLAFVFIGFAFDEIVNPRLRRRR
jgi:peptide/nickel transport system permease protein